MLRSLYTAATGMGAMQKSISVISNNLANVNTLGYKRSRAEFQDLLYQTERMPGTKAPGGMQVPTGIQIGMGTRLAAVSKLHTQGDFEQTGNELDLSIEGKGFFQVLQADGSTGYTRVGSFRLDSNGQLVSSDGEPLEPSIIIPQDAMVVSIAKNGEVSVTQPGSPLPNVVGQIELANFVNPAGLSSEGGGIYKETEASGSAIVGIAGESELGTIMQGFVESSNVNVVEELTNMILAQRAYELNSKGITTSDEMLQTATNLKR